MNPRWRCGVLILLVALAAAACSSDSNDEAGADGAPTAGDPTTTEAPAYPRDDELRLNEIQVLGSHNSYHQRLQPELQAALEAQIPGMTTAWQYQHLPLPEQFADQGIRQIELDVFADPEGGLYAIRNAQEAAGLPADPGIPELSEPGFKVMHIQELDVESSCWTFVQCLEQVEGWSDANPGHVPIMILVEAKDGTLAIGGPELEAIDDEIRSVFDDDQMITPDFVRGDHATLEEAVLTDGWPTLGATRGRVMFGLDNGDVVMEAYLDGHPSLEGRAMFTGGTPAGNPASAFMKLNDPIADFAAIQEAVRAGYVVRTRADGDLHPVDPAPNEQRDQALASGAQWVSTDFPVADPLFESGYSATIPDGTPGRCNPLVAPDWCTSADVEDPAALSP